MLPQMAYCHDDCQGKPNPTDLAPEHLKHLAKEEAWIDEGDPDRSPGQEVTGRIEGREVSDALASVRAAVEQTVRSHDQGEVGPEQPPGEDDRSEVRR